MLCLAMVAGLLMLSATPAAAANDVQSVSPGSGSTLTSSPGEVRLVFERPLLSLVSVSVSGPAGNVAQGSAQVRGNTVVQALDARLTNGRYTVSWQVRGLLESSSGSSGFRIARKASKPNTKPSPKVSPTPTPTPKASPSPSRSPRPSRSPKASRTTAVAVPIDTATPPSSSAYVAAPQVKGVGYTGSDHLPPPIVWWGLVLVLALIGYVIKKQVDARRSAAPRMVQRMPPGLVPGRRVQRDDNQRHDVDDDGFDDGHDWSR